MFVCYVICLNFCVVLMGHNKFYKKFTVKRLGKTMKISVIYEASVSDMHSRWCHGHIAVVICHSHWTHCRPFCCTKHVNKPKMTADTMASQLWMMMLCSVKRHSCQMHMWVTSHCITYAQVQEHCITTCHLLSRCPCNNVCVCLSMSLCRQTYFLVTLWWEHVQRNFDTF